MKKNNGRDSHILLYYYLPIHCELLYFILRKKMLSNHDTHCFIHLLRYIKSNRGVTEQFGVLIIFFSYLVSHIMQLFENPTSKFDLSSQLCIIQLVFLMGPNKSNGFCLTKFHLNVKGSSCIVHQWFHVAKHQNKRKEKSLFTFSNLM